MSASMAFNSLRAARSSSSLASTSAIRLSGSQRYMHISSPAQAAPRPDATMPAVYAGQSVPTNALDAEIAYPNHPLRQFFRTYKAEIPNGTDDKGKPLTKSIDRVVSVREADLGRDASGRSYLAPELRLKSSHELHLLWYVLIRERNILASSWEELKRAGAQQAARMNEINLGRRAHRVRKSMARIKLVLNERRLALISAQEAARSDANPTALEEEAENLFEEDVSAAAARESKADAAAQEGRVEGAQEQGEQVPLGAGSSAEARR